MGSSGKREPRFEDAAALGCGGDFTELQGLSADMNGAVLAFVRYVVESKVDELPGVGELADARKPCAD